MADKSKLVTPTVIGNNIETKRFLQLLANKSNVLSVTFEPLPSNATTDDVITKVNQIIETLNKL